MCMKNITHIFIPKSGSITNLAKVCSNLIFTVLLNILILDYPDTERLVSFNTKLSFSGLHDLKIVSCSVPRTRPLRLSSNVPQMRSL